MARDRRSALDRTRGECMGHPAGPNDPMGQTNYCNGACRERPGHAERERHLALLRRADTLITVKAGAIVAGDDGTAQAVCRLLDDIRAELAKYPEVE